MNATTMQPIELGPNQPKQFYRGGQAIAALRGLEGRDGFRPEDWVGSTTPRFGSREDGLSKLPDGRYLKDVVEADPANWLGPDHAGYFGASPALLVKLLEAGERLPVHVHPSRSFALRHLGSRHGKTESWIVLGTAGAEPVVYLGWSRDVGSEEVWSWVAEQDTKAMVGNLNKLSVQSGDALLVPAGTPHAIGEGVFSVELQEPSDFSIMLEFEGFDIDPSGGEAGLGRELALSCLRHKAFGPAELEQLTRRPHRTGTLSHGNTGAPVSTPTIEDVLPPAANPYFRAQRVRGGSELELEASFAIIVVVSGGGALCGDGWKVSVKTGDTLVVPWGAGSTRVEGRLELLRCLPPLPSDAATDDPATNDAVLPPGR